MLKPREPVDHLPGFDAPQEDETQSKESSSKKKKKGSGGFQTMGLSFPIIKGITKRGYKQPTPIQRKTIPLALEGKDVVAMARTGSGKTACFVLPILEKLLSPNHKAMPGKNFRALILSPTRELALQTLRFVRELGKFTGLTSAAILGGESIEQQFSTMSGTAPDIVVATPGRFLHICIEMSLKLENIRVIVFDEADRLFELGFGEQLQELVARLPSGRQTLLFSATLPKMLVEFARAGLSDPVLIRLDVDWKLPSTLWLGWIAVRAELKTAALLLLLDKVLTEKTPQAVVFAATKHHVEYLHLILQQAGITSTYAYSGLDASARKIAIGRFSNKKCSVLIVTDVAARGLDLPALDTVINYNFPAKPKLFVHRVGKFEDKIALGLLSNKKCSVLIVTDVAARGLDLPALDTVINYNFPAKPKLFVHRVGKFEDKIALGLLSNKKCSVLIVTDVAARGLDLPALDTVINYNFPAKPKLFVHRVGKFKDKIALGRFSNKKCSVLIVTDVAARGLDLPALDTVINYNFPAKPKLFVHRVGRSARAGRAGRAFSLIAAEDMAHLLDLQLFLGTELIPATSSTARGAACPSGVWGAAPTGLLEMRHQDVVSWEKNHSEIEDAARVCGRGWQQYIKWREPASAEANRRAKLNSLPNETHPFLVDENTDAANDLVRQIKNYTPKGTILELSAKNDSPMYQAMKIKKQKHGKLVQKSRDNKKLQAEGVLVDNNEKYSRSSLSGQKKKKKEVVRDENYIPHTASDQHTEMGMSVNFNASAAQAQMDLGADSGDAARAHKHMLKWDRKRKKMVHVDPDGGRKMIRTESGGRVPASYRSGRYDEWRKRNAPDVDSDGDERADTNRKRPVSDFRPHWVKHNERVAKKAAESDGKEFKNKQQIVKERIRKEKIKAKLKFKSKNKRKKKK